MNHCKTNIAELSHSQCGGIDKRTIEKFEKEAQESGKVIYFSLALLLNIVMMSTAELTFLMSCIQCSPEALLYEMYF